MRSVGVDDHEHPEFRAEAEQDDPFLLGGVVGIVDQERVVVVEHRDGLRERHSVPPFVLGGFAWVPLELQVAHPSRIFTLYCSGKVPPDPSRRLAASPSDVVLPTGPKRPIMAKSKLLSVGFYAGFSGSDEVTRLS